MADDLRRRTLDDDSDIYLILNPRGLVIGRSIGTTPGAKHEIFEKLPEFDEISLNTQKSYFDRIPEFERWRDASNGTLPEPEPLSKTYFTRSTDGGFLVAIPVPPIPDYPWEDPNYHVIAYSVQKITPTIFEDFYVFADRVRRDVRKNIIVCVVLGLIGLVVVLSILAVMSHLLTQPLTWITVVARKVINNETEKSKRASTNSEFSYSYSDKKERIRESKKRKQEAKKKRNLFSSTSRQYFSEGNSNDAIVEVDSLSVDDSSRANRDLEADAQLEDGFVNFDYHPDAGGSPWCTLSTELVQLLEAFQSMIHGFSGDGVSEVAEPGFYEIRNTLTWHSDFSKLFDVNIEAEDIVKKLSSTRQVSSSTRATTIGSVGEGSSSTWQLIRFVSDASEKQSSIQQESPEFYSSTIHDQESSDELSIQGSRFKQESGIILPGLPPKASHTIVPAPVKVNLVSNLGSPEFEPKPIVQNREKPFQKTRTAVCSRLFWWIVVLMVSCGKYPNFYFTNR